MNKVFYGKQPAKRRPLVADAAAVAAAQGQMGVTGQASDAAAQGLTEPAEQASIAEAPGTFEQKAPAHALGKETEENDRHERQQAVIDDRDVQRGTTILKEYMRGKQALDRRLIEDELWWQMRHWEVKRREKDQDHPLPASAWLFNVIVNKHADAMDNFPVPVVLPREKSDDASAKTLSSVLPVVLESNQFEDTYWKNWWEKLKHGVAAYGVFWDNDKLGGLGDISVRAVDVLRLYWEPGVTDLEQSRNLFVIELHDVDEMETAYPEHKGRFGGDLGEVKQYLYDETIDTTKKCMVVDWYYKVRLPSGRTVLHYIKFSGNVLLYASENEDAYREIGFYAHGRYPIELDTLYPEKGTPAGFGYVSVCKDAQIYIDAISANIQESTLLSTKRRYFASKSMAINEDDLLDATKPIVWVEGEIDDRRLKQMTVNPIDANSMSVMLQKIEEMKETASNRDMNNGGGGKGVTAAAAIAALQEAGNKTSRDMIAASYRVYARIASLCVELMRQFYDEARSFRIVGPGAGYDFVSLDNEQIREQAEGQSQDGETLYRLPIFDFKIKAIKKNPFSRMEENERAKEFYRLGFFSPDRAEEASRALNMMDFEGIDKVREEIEQGKTLLNTVKSMAEQIEQMKAVISALAQSAPASPAPVSPTAGTPNVPAGSTAKQATPPPSAAGGTAQPLTDAVLAARTPMTGYGQNLAKRSGPDMENV